MTARTPAGTDVDLDPKALDALKARLRGAVLPAGEPAYDEARSVWNAMIDRRPAFIVKCLGVADVIACVQFAREHRIRLGVKSGGHNIAGLAIAEGGLQIDLSQMRGVWVDPAARVARAQGGCLLGDIDRETQLHGLAAPLGFVSATGAAGLTLGGGLGYLTRKHGWTCDNVRAIDVVLADGRLVRASHDSHPDLFWALRGGGGNYGVAVGFEYDLYPIGPEIVGGAMAWPADEAPRVLGVFQQVLERSTEDLVCVAGFRKAPPAPWLAKEIHGKDICLVVVCHAGPIADAEREIAPLKALGSKVGDVVMRRTYVSQQSLLDATQPKGRRYYWKSEYLRPVSRDLLDAAAAHGRSTVSPHSAVLIFPLAGALNRLPDDTSPAGNRDAQAILNVAAAWDSAADDQANVGWAREVWQDLRRFSTGGVYVNFLTEDEGGDRTAQAYGAHLDRLAAIKATWDPENLFNTNKNVAPRR